VRALACLLSIFAALAASAPARSAAEAPPAEPAPPRAQEQTPRPYLTRAPEPIERRVLVGVDLGMVQRPVASDARVAYSPAPIYAAHARLELLDWFGYAILEFLDVRAIAALNSHEVEARSGPALSAPDISTIQLGARAEPTWTVTATVRLWVGLGVAWERMQMDAYDAPGPGRLHIPRRVGVAVEYSGGIGSIIDLIPNWLALELGLIMAWPEHQTGSLFETVQVFDAAGQRSSVGGMPLFERSHYGFAGLSLVL
jgi:hypothetical protein